MLSLSSSFELACYVVICIVLLTMSRKLATPVKQYYACPPRIIWSYWNTAKPPRIVEVCVKSWKIHNPGFEIRLLSVDTFKQFVDISDLPKMWDLIPPAQQADVIRLALLRKYGGYWVDSTVLMNRGIAQVWETSDFDLGGFNGEHHQILKNKLVLENWFLAAPQNSKAIRAWFDEFVGSFDKCPTQTSFNENRDEYAKQLKDRKINLQGMSSYDHRYYSAYCAFMAMSYHTDKFDADSGNIKTFDANIKNPFGDGPFAFFSEGVIPVMTTRKFSRCPMIKFTRYEREPFENNFDKITRESTIGDVLYL